MSIYLPAHCQAGEIWDHARQQGTNRADANRLDDFPPAGDTLALAALEALHFDIQVSHGGLF